MLALPVVLLIASAIFLPWLVWVVWSGFVSVRQKSLLSVMDLAVRRRMPLDAGIAAFGETYGGMYRRKTLALARLLREGVPLGQSLRKIPGMLSPHSQITAEIGEATGGLETALHAASEQENRRQHGVSQLAVRVCYFAFTFTISQAVLAFVSYWIVPKLKHIFADFGVELPHVTALMIDITDFMVDSGIVIVIYLFSILLIFIAPIALFATVLGYPLLRTDFLETNLRRSHCGTVLRCLALCVQQGQPLPTALAMLADLYPVRRIANRLHQASILISEGMDWLQSLRKTGIIGSAETALLATSQRNENLVWAMFLVADSSDRRFWYRMSMWLQAIGPALVLVVAVPVALYAIAIFMPLITLLNELGIDA